MVRSDQERFDQFSRHLETIDAELDAFCHEVGLELVRYQNRHPGRILRRPGNPLRLIDIRLEGVWYSMEYQPDLPHTVGEAAYYQPTEGKRLRKRAFLVEHQPLSLIRRNLKEILEQSHALVQSWPPPILSEEDPDAASQGWERTLF
jgi:hypothetical protein